MGRNRPRGSDWKSNIASRWLVREERHGAIASPSEISICANYSNVVEGVLESWKAGRTLTMHFV
jgi:hypothetical protein